MLRKARERSGIRMWRHCDSGLGPAHNAELPTIATVRPKPVASNGGHVKILVVDPPYFTLPYDLHFCRALAMAGATVELVGRPLRSYEEDRGEPFPMRSLFYRLSEGGGDWRTSRATKLLKGIEHVAGLVALDRLAATFRPDIVHVQWLVIPALDGPALRRLGRRSSLVLTMHNNSLAAHSAETVVGGVGAAAQRLGRRDILGLFDGFIAHTELTRSHLEATGIPARRIRVLAHPPLSLGDLRAAPPDGTVRILFFGSIKPYKGVDVLVRAALELLPGRPNCRVDVVGRPFEALDQERTAVAVAGLEDRFGFDLRYIPDQDLARYLGAADIVVFPYREIDASGALALAIQAGKPVVASAIGVFAEMPTADHVLLVPPGEPSALARALASLVDDLPARQRLAAASVALRGAMASWSTFAAGCLQLYRECQETR